MYRKKLFLESVHKLGLGSKKENIVISLFEATHEDEPNLIADENPSDMQDALSGEIEEKPEGSAFEEPSEEVSENKQEIERIINTLDMKLKPYLTANVYQHSLPSTPNGTNMMVELKYRLNEFKLGWAYHDMNEAMKWMSWEVIQFNKADDPAEAWKLQFNPGAANTKKYNAITMIRKYMLTIILNLVIITKKIGLTEPLNLMKTLSSNEQRNINNRANNYLLTNRF